MQLPQPIYACVKEYTCHNGHVLEKILAPWQEYFYMSKKFLPQRTCEKKTLQLWQELWLKDSLLLMLATHYLLLIE